MAGNLDPVMAPLYFVLFYVFINYMLLEMMVALIVEQSQLSEKRREALQFEQYVRGTSSEVLDGDEAPLAYAQAIYPPLHAHSAPI